MLHNDRKSPWKSPKIAWIQSQDPGPALQMTNAASDSAKHDIARRAAEAARAAEDTAAKAALVRDFPSLQPSPAPPPPQREPLLPCRAVGAPLPSKHFTCRTLQASFGMGPLPL